MTTCIIAEKPSVARDIARIVGANRREDGFLEGADYLVTWAFGHLITLSMPEQYGYGAYKAEELPIVPQPFQLMVRQIRKGKDFEDDPTALKQLKIIRSCFEKSDQIIVATDAGREGELIFRYIYGYLGCQKPFRRLWISSLTDKAIREGLAQLKAGSAYDALYLAGKARSEADWLVGINASRALSIARRGAYSLGRVQTPTLAMICRRYLEHQGFSSVPFGRLQAIVQKDGVLFQTTCAEDFATEGEAQTAFATLSRQSSLVATSVSRKVAAMPPPLLYDLTTLQKEANRQLGYSADKTLSLAQSLYEKKVTTYPRTGSRYISQDVFEEVPRLLSVLGKELKSPLNPHSVDDSKVTDHHALLPTGEGNAQTLSSDEAAIYQMICARFVAAFAPNAQEERIEALEKEAEQAQYLSEKEKNDIRKEVVVLQDRLKDKDRELAQERKELKAYEEERSFIQRFLSPLFALLNVRRNLSYMGFPDEQIPECIGQAKACKPKRKSSLHYISVILRRKGLCSALRKTRSTTPI